MALSYSAILRVPIARVFTSIDYLQFWEFTSGTTSAFLTIPQVLADAKALLEALFGGTFSWVTSSDATYNIYTISWAGLTSDPALGVYGNITAIYYLDILGDNGSAQFISADLCEATGSCTPCPPSVNPDDATDCLSCYPLEIEFCASTFDIEGLEADTEYTIKIKDNVSNKTYDYVATSDQYGIIEITTANYPTGVFTPFNSPLSITILDANGDPVILTYGYVNYSCLELNVTNTTTIV
jgi:hypothetical protein